VKNRPKMFVSSNFTVASDTTVELVDCKVIEYVGWNMDSANAFTSEFKGDVLLEQWDIYFDGHPAVFIDRLESYETKELLII